MKHFVICLLFLCTAGLAQAELSMEFIQDFMLIVTKCKTKVGVVDNDLNKLLEKDATSHKGKCLVLCVMDSLGLVKNKEFDIEAAYKLAKKHLDFNKKQMALVTKIHEECSQIKDPDMCEMMYKRTICAHEAAQRLNLNIFGQ